MPSRGRIRFGSPSELRLPEPVDPRPVELRLYPLRSRLDRRRVVATHRLAACAVPYAEPLGQGPGDTRLTRAWRLAWTPATGALLEVAGLAGVTLEQAAEGAPRTTWPG